MKRSMRPRGRRVVLRGQAPPSDGEFCCLISYGLPLVITSCHCPPSLAIAHSRAFQGVHLTIHGPSHTHTHTHYSRAFPAVHIECDRHAPLATVQRAVLEPIDAVREPRGEEHLLV